MEWIQARRECSLEHAWLTLGKQVKNDVERWKELNTNPAVPVEIKSEGSLIVVSRRHPGAGAKQWVRIVKTESAIKFVLGK
jgi:hypothetical protein